MVRYGWGMPLGRFQLAAVSLIGLLVLGGCHSRPDLRHADRGLFLGYDDRPGSLVLAGRAPVATTAQTAVPWYAWRNDVGPTVSVGYDSARYERSVTYTRDRQTIIGGRVFDRYDQTTYRRTVRESVR